MENNSNYRPSIEQEVSTILKRINANIPDDVVARLDKLSKWSTCRGLIGVYNRADLKLEEKNRNQKARPLRQYDFYPHHIYPSRLGSVAIYGENASGTLAALQRSESIFGHRILAANIEMGLRPFIDVTLG